MQCVHVQLVLPALVQHRIETERTECGRQLRTNCTEGFYAGQRRRGGRGAVAYRIERHARKAWRGKQTAECEHKPQSQAPELRIHCRAKASTRPNRSPPCLRKLWSKKRQINTAGYSDPNTALTSREMSWLHARGHETGRAECAAECGRNEADHEREDQSDDEEHDQYSGASPPISPGKTPADSNRFNRPRIIHYEHDGREKYPAEDEKNHEKEDDGN